MQDDHSGIFRHPESGFRFSRRDLAVLILGAIVAVPLAFFSLQTATLILFVVGHFFLFCNVFRIRQSCELTWTAIFLFFFLVGSFFGLPVYTILLCHLPVSMTILFMETRHPSYHGIKVFAPK